MKLNCRLSKGQSTCSKVIGLALVDAHAWLCIPHIHAGVASVGVARAGPAMLRGTIGSL